MQDSGPLLGQFGNIRQHAWRKMVIKHLHYQGFLEWKQSWGYLVAEYDAKIRALDCFSLGARESCRMASIRYHAISICANCTF